MTDCIVKWDGGSETIKNAKLGDPRVGLLLDRLARNGAKRPSVEFVDDFLADEEDASSAGEQQK